MTIRSLIRHSMTTTMSLALALFGAGCGGPTPESSEQGAPSEESESGAAKSSVHDPNDVPITEEDVERPEDYADAVARIEGSRDSIRDDITAGNPAEAHRALDELNIVLDWLPEIARDSGVPKDQWETVNTAAQTLREQFNAVHAQIDAGEEANYSAVNAEVEDAIGQLQSVEAPEIESNNAQS